MKDSSLANCRRNDMNFQLNTNVELLEPEHTKEQAFEIINNNFMSIINSLRHIEYQINNMNEHLEGHVHLKTVYRDEFMGTIQALKMDMKRDVNDILEEEGYILGKIPQDISA